MAWEIELGLPNWALPWAFPSYNQYEKFNDLFLKAWLCENTCYLTKNKLKMLLMHWVICIFTYDGHFYCSKYLFLAKGRVWLFQVNKTVIRMPYASSLVRGCIQTTEPRKKPPQRLLSWPQCLFRKVSGLLWTTHPQATPWTFRSITWANMRILIFGMAVETVFDKPQKQNKRKWNKTKTSNSNPRHLILDSHRRKDPHAWKLILTLW